MKVLMIHQHYYPEMSGTARRSKDLAESFVKRGHLVSVITSYPRNFRSFPEMTFKNYEKINGVNIFRLNTVFQVRNNVLFRILSYFSFIIKSLFYALKLSKSSDIIISISPLPSGIIGSLVQRINNRHHHFDIPKSFSLVQ